MRSDRFNFIDGTKGIAAILVVFCHLSCVFLPTLCFYEKSASQFEKFWLSTPLNAITNGNTPVMAFFLFSGFLITYHTYTSQSSRLGGYKLLGILVKLFKIIVPSILFSFILMKCNFMFHLDAYKLNSDLDFVLDYNNFSPTFFGLLKDIVRTLIKGSRFVGPLWTICYELLGSTVISTVAYYAKNSDNRILLYIVVSVPFFGISTNIISFLVGAIICDIYLSENKNEFSYLLKNILNCKWLKIVLILLAVILSTLNDNAIGIYAIFQLVKPLAGIFPLLRAVGLSILLFYSLESMTIQNVLSLKIFVKLGKLSPYIYAFHWQIILSLGCLIFIKLYKIIDYKILVLMISVIVILATVFLAFIYVKFLDRVSPT